MFIFQTLYSTFFFLLVFSGNTVFAFFGFAIPGQNMLSEIFGNKTEAEVYEESPSGRIINGAKVPDGKYNFVASLQALNIQNKWIHYCGGSILNEKYILTAAHCCFYPKNPEDPQKTEYLPFPVDKVRVVIGSHNLKNINKDLIFSVESIIPNADFDRKKLGLGNDVAVYKLAGKIPFDSPEAIKGSNFEKSCFPSSGEVEPAGDDCIVTGWGLTSGTEPKPHPNDDLLEVKTAMITDERTCQGKIIDSKNLICSSQENGGSCNGDSGGVYLCPVKSDPDVWLQFGIVSFGDEKCTSRMPGFYTRVSTYIDWIMEHGKPEN